MTDQRHERTFQTLLLAGKVIALLALVLAGAGCGSSGPTGPSEVRPPARNEALAREYIACHAAYWGYTLTVQLQIVDHRRSDGAQAWGDMRNRVITVVRPSLESWAPVDVEMVMGHELAHVMGEWDEDEATRQASQAYYAAGCHQ